jgi:hypothetical protein
MLLLAFASLAAAQPKIDNVLQQMVPPGTATLTGVHMDLVKQSVIYKKMVAGRNLVQVDQFAAETGFDPRRDVRELLLASSSRGSVMLARGTFHLHPAVLQGAKKIRRGQYDIWVSGGSGFCILDSTLAAAGEIPLVEAALDEWKSGTHTAAQPLLARASGINPQTQLWGVSTATGNFLADHQSSMSGGLDLSKIFRGLQDAWLQADLTTGLKAEIHGTTATEKDAMSLRDALRGIIGLGRLNVPETQSELLKVWDGIEVDQQGRAISLHIDIAQDLIDKMVEMLSAGAVGARRLL